MISRHLLTDLPGALFPTLLARFPALFCKQRQPRALLSRHFLMSENVVIVFVVTTKDFGCTANSLSSAMIRITRL
jgi:hypothetical protein